MIACPACGKLAKVQETRTVSDEVRRTYKCDDHHRFATREVPTDVYDRLIQAQAFVERVKEMARA